ncbi:TRAP transporter substrate-binding protein DctP [Pseudogracilibacillus sp. SE30717A]|uniref:TRAP transporter substrate-binding protein n=1 Tax=Pseudogracilibacillus sp. SE30717A TaxID=3098293 RepID=UPI00300E06B5
MLKQRKKFLFMGLLVATVLVLFACNNGTKQEVAKSAENGEANKDASEEKVVIKIADSFPTNHQTSVLGIQPWIERIEELGEGKIEVEYYPAEQLSKEASLLDAAKNKIADITYVGAQYMTDELPLTAIAGNPGIVQDAISGSKAFNKLVQEDLYELELKPNGVKPLWAVTTNPYQIINSTHPIETIDDFKGLKIRTSGGLQENLVQYWEASPVSTTAPEIYTAWERGTIDGALLSIISWSGYQLEELVKYSTTNAALSSFGIMYVVNEEVWNSWPEDVQEAVSQASEEAIEMLSTGYMDAEKELMQEYAELGVEFYDIPEEELKKWNDSLGPLNEEWAKNLDQRGLPASEILDKFIQYNNEFKE